MAKLYPTIAGRILQTGLSFGDDDAWSDLMPDADSAATAISTSDGAQYRTIMVDCGYNEDGSSLGVEIRSLLMSFDTSGISSAPDSATLNIYGHTQVDTGTAGHSTNGILCLKTTLAATDALETSDWGRIDLSGAGPTLYSDTLTNWTLGTDIDEYNHKPSKNTFTLNSTALTDIGNNDTFQVAVVHKFMYDHYDADPPFAFGDNSPEGDDGISHQAGAYFIAEELYKPFISIPEEPKGNINIGSGEIKLSGGKLKF